MVVLHALKFAFVCAGVLVSASLRRDDEGVMDHTKHAPLRLSLARR